jgi:arylsulfatase A-like enzyme
MMTTDHGGGLHGHGAEADSDILIPMFVRGPGVRVGQQFENIVRNMDIVPTAGNLF